MEDRKYGTDPEMDKLVDSTNVKDRVKAASKGYALDVLKNDTEEEVRVYVAYECASVNYKRLDILKALSEDKSITVLKCVAGAIHRKDIAADNVDFSQSVAIIDVLQSVAMSAIAAYNDSDKEYMSNKMINMTLSEVLKKTVSITSKPDLDPFFMDTQYYIFDMICDNPYLNKSCTDRDTYYPPDAPPTTYYEPVLVTLAEVTKCEDILNEIAKMTENIPKGYRSNDNAYTSAAKCRLKELKIASQKNKDENER